MGAPDRAIAPIPDAGGKMTMPYHTQLSAPVPLTTSLQFGSPRDKSLAFGCAVHSPHRQKWLAPVQRPCVALHTFSAALTADFRW